MAQEYTRRPGPWKRYTDAAGGNSDAGAMLSHIHLRYKTNDALVHVDGKLCIIQPVRCWQQELPLTKGRVRSAFVSLQEHGLIEVSIQPAFSPSQVTHICLTLKAQELLNRASPHKSSSRSSSSSLIDRPAASQSTGSLADSNKLFTCSPTESSKTSFSCEERDEDNNNEERNKKRKRKAARRMRRSSSGAEDEVSEITLHDMWIRIEKEKTPDLPPAQITPHERNLLPDATRALGHDAEMTIRAVYEDWTSFGYFLQRNGRKHIAKSPNFCGLLMAAGLARRWAVQQARTQQEDPHGHLSPQARKHLGL